MPLTGTPAGIGPSLVVVPNLPEVDLISGRAAMGTENLPQRSGDHPPVRRSNSIVLLALEGSVACTAPPVSFHSSQASTVPRRRLSSATTAPSVRSHSNLVAEK